MNNIRYCLLFFTGICLFYAGTQVNNPTLTYGNWTLLKDLPECILSYRKYLKEYILFCSKSIHSSMHNTPIDTVIPNTPYRIEELFDDGHLYTRIEHELDNIRLYFKHKWEL